MTKTTFSTNSVAYPLQKDEFKSLKRIEKGRLIRLMARISEASYRRGLQHGVHFTKNNIQIEDPYNFRYGRSLNNSKFADGPGGFTSIERLWMEFGILREIGFMDVYPNDFIY
jgi:hypothetical protein